MKIRYMISEKWQTPEIIEVMNALHFAIDYFKLQNEKATLTVKLQTGNIEEPEADACRLKNHRYELRLNYARLNELNLLKAIFHEMTHVKQFVYDQFLPSNKEIRWKGQTFEANMSDSKAYFLSPWEMEARAMEEAMEFFYDESQ